MTDATPAEPITSPETTSPDTGLPPTTLDAVRKLVLRAHPEVVAELVQGDSVEALIASIEPASQAYASIATRMVPVAEVAPPPVPAGTTPSAPIDLDQLPTAEKLRRGIHERQRQRR